MIEVLMAFHPSGEIYFTSAAPQALADRHALSQYGPVVVLQLEESQIPPRGLVPRFRLERIA